MTTHNPMPVSGYTPQSQSNVDLANEGKAFEEQYLRWLDKLEAHPDTDKRNVALARTYMENAAMRAIRSIFKPQRIKLPGDAP
ncbi:MAG: hypothetical protein E6Q97_04310 [Desulfurellales bacterium]|nr:MAG: hypothetical protein E6Q97_04310 [Desulfurellales bacterium]